MIAVIVLSYNDAFFAKNCIESVKERINKNNHKQKIYLVNNGCDEKNTRILELICVDSYLQLSENFGLPIGYNMGIKQALLDHPKYICLLNADTKVITDNWLENMVKVFKEKPDAGMVATMTNKISNRKQNWKYFNKKLPMQIIESNWVGLGMTMIPTRIIKEIGLLDEAMTPGAGVDTEYSLRLLTKGYKCYVDGSTFVWHKGKTAFKQLPISYRELQRRNTQYIKNKYPNDWRKVLK